MVPHSLPYYSVYPFPVLTSQFCASLPFINIFFSLKLHFILVSFFPALILLANLINKCIWLFTTISPSHRAELSDLISGQAGFQ